MPDRLHSDDDRGDVCVDKRARSELSVRWPYVLPVPCRSSGGDFRALRTSHAPAEFMPLRRSHKNVQRQ